MEGGTLVVSSLNSYAKGEGWRSSSLSVPQSILQKDFYTLHGCGDRFCGRPGDAVAMHLSLLDPKAASESVSRLSADEPAAKAWLASSPALTDEARQRLKTKYFLFSPALFHRVCAPVRT